MTANEIMAMRTGISDEATIETYIAMATARVVTFLGLSDTDDLSSYVTQIADIGVLLWEQDTATRNASANLGFESHSFSEGGISESVSGYNGQVIWETYAAAIDNVLQTLKGVRMGVVRFL